MLPLLRLFFVFVLLPFPSYAQTTVTAHVKLSGEARYKGQDYTLSFNGQKAQFLESNRDTILYLPVESLPALLLIGRAWNGKGRGQMIRLVYVTQEEISFSGSFARAKRWDITPVYAKQWVMDSLYATDDQDRRVDLIRQHPDIPTASPLLSYAMTQGVDYEKARRVYEILTPENKANEWGIRIAAKLATYQQPTATLGENYVDFEAIDAEGNVHRLSDYIGRKPVLLDFSDHGCRPCVQAIPELATIDSLYGDQVQLISVWRSPNREKWQRLVHSQYPGPVTWHDWWDYQQLGFFRYDFYTNPTFFIISPEGVLEEKWKGYTAGGILNRVERYLSVSGKTN
ncbi:MAG TPA: hypothetical protein DCR93_38775 [Cytophagales bacterium]|nr:hypothetical protein [Cytophagales bacterium]